MDTIDPKVTKNRQQRAAPTAKIKKTTAGGGNRPLAWLEPVCLEQADNDCRIGDPSVTEGDDGTLYISCSYRVSNGDGVSEKICVIQYDGLKG